MSQIKQSIPIQIRSKLKVFRKQAQQQYKKYNNNPSQWFIDQVIKNKINIPRITLLRQSIDLITTISSSVKIIDQIFLQQSSLNHILIQSQNFVDIAFVLYQHLLLKNKLKKIQYSSLTLQTIHNKLSYYLQKQKKKIPSLLRLNYIQSFISFKQVNTNQIYDQINQFQLSQIRQQLILLFNYLIKPWIEKSHPTQYYQELTQIVYWYVMLDDDSKQKQMFLINLTDLIQHYFCPKKRSDSAFTYFKCFAHLMNLLAVNYRKQDPFKIYTLAPLLNAWEKQIHIQQISTWLQDKSKNLKPQQVQNIFRNTFHIGSTIFMFNLINYFSKALKKNKQFNVLYHIFLSYIKKDYLDIILPNSTFIQTYFEILEFYVIGFINHDRLEGESQLDKLTHNLSSLLLNRKFVFKQHYYTVIMFYKVYQARFSYLSSVSRRFVSDLQRLSKIKIQLIDIHNKIHEGAFREAGYAEQQNSGFQQLNIKRTDRYRGMMNLGNTCYMNSFMQAMFMTKKFRSAILQIRDQQNIPYSKTNFYALSNLFTELSTKTIGVDTQIIPQLFKMETPQPFKSSWDQHDVAQFGRMYIQSLANQLQDDRNRQRIQKIFSSKLKKSLICYNCKTQKSNLETVFDIILHFNKSDDSISISKMLGQYFKGQVLSNENQVYCERCRRKTDALARPHPIRLAEFLMITIGLFEYSGGGKKIKKPFNFEFTINFSKILPNQTVSDQNYELYAFIVHIGNQVERGHYICYARNLEQNPTIWYCFDDSYVTEKQIETVQQFRFGQSQTPYVLFYSSTKKRKSVQLNFDKIGSKLFGK